MHTASALMFLKFYYIMPDDNSLKRNM